MTKFDPPQPVDHLLMDASGVANPFCPRHSDVHDHQAGPQLDSENDTLVMR